MFQRNFEYRLQYHINEVWQYYLSSLLQLYKLEFEPVKWMLLLQKEVEFNLRIIDNEASFKYGI